MFSSNDTARIAGSLAAVVLDRLTSRYSLVNDWWNEQGIDTQEAIQLGLAATLASDVTHEIAVALRGKIVVVVQREGESHKALVYAQGTVGGTTGEGPSVAHALVDLAATIRRDHFLASRPDLPLTIDDPGRISLVSESGS